MQSFHKPSILNYYEFDDAEHGKYLTKEFSREAFLIKCKFCASKIRASIRVTSNWKSHLRKHDDKLREYELGLLHRPSKLISMVIANNNQASEARSLESSLQNKFTVRCVLNISFIFRVELVCI
jgi:hypothetical protein